MSNLFSLFITFMPVDHNKTKTSLTFMFVLTLFVATRVEK